MKKTTRSTGVWRAAWLALLLGPGCQMMTAAPVAAQERAIATEKNPPGDIPDSQVFVAYASPLGFSLKVPEGWSRKDVAGGAIFSDKYNQVDVAVSDAAVAPTAADVKTGAAADLEKNGRAVKISAIKELQLPSGSAVMIVYESNSDPNPVNNKQIRLENERFLIARSGKLAALTFSAPAGADNADQWKLMRDSFGWK